MKELGLRINSRLKIKDLRLKIKDLSYILSLISCLLVFAPSAHAQQVSFPKQYLSVTPIISELKLVPGKNTSYELKVKNLANAPLGISAEVGNLVEPDSIDIGEDVSPIIKWTKLSENDFIIDAKSEKTIKVTINPPKDIKESGYYEVIYLTPFVGGQNQKEKPVVLSRIGALVFATYGDLNYKNLKEKVKISTFSPTSFFQKKSEFDLDLEVENNYFTHFSAKPVVVVNSLFGSKEKFELEEKHILPGKSRIWQIAGPLKKWGIYKAKLALSIGNGEQIFANTTFVFLPLREILIVILIFFVIFFVIFRKKRLKKALRILAGKT